MKLDLILRNLRLFLLALILLSVKSRPAAFALVVNKTHKKKRSSLHSAPRFGCAQCTKDCFLLSRRSQYHNRWLNPLKILTNDLLYLVKDLVS